MRLRLIVERIKRGQTQKEVANEIGITTQMLSKYERSKIQPTYETMKKISAYYSLPVESLFGEETEL